MAGIPGIIYAIVGALVAGFSYFINLKTNSTALNLFMWVGLAMLAYGVVKMIFMRAFKSKLPKEEAPPEENLKKIMQQQKLKYCPKCGAKLPPVAKFCYMCGTKA